MCILKHFNTFSYMKSAPGVGNYKNTNCKWRKPWKYISNYTQFSKYTKTVNQHLNDKVDWSLHTECRKKKNRKLKNLKHLCIAASKLIQYLNIQQEFIIIPSIRKHSHIDYKLINALSLLLIFTHHTLRKMLL